MARAAPLLAATLANWVLMLSRTSQSVEPILPYAHVTDSSARESVSLSIGRGIGQRSVVFSFSFSKRNAPESAIVLTVWTGGSCCFHAQFLTGLLSHISQQHHGCQMSPRRWLARVAYEIRTASRADTIAITRRNHTPPGNGASTEQPLQIHVTKSNTSDELSSEWYSLQRD